MTGPTRKILDTAKIEILRLMVASLCISVSLLQDGLRRWPGGAPKQDFLRRSVATVWRPQPSESGGPGMGDVNCAL